MTTRHRVAPHELKVGDFLRAAFSGGGTVTALTLEVTATTIRVRDICRQEEMEFDRKTGEARRTDSAITCRICSTEQMPAEHHEALLGLDRKYRLGRALTEEESKLTPAEKKALLFNRP